MNGPTPEQIAASGSEHGQQAALFCWATTMLAKYPCLEYMYAIPNGGFRNVREAAKFKAEGVKAGVLDVCLPYPRRTYHGLYIEMKRPKSKGRAKGRLSDEQKRWIEFLRSQNYCVFSDCDFSTAKELILGYVELPPF